MSDVAIPPRSRPVGVFLVLFAAAAAGAYVALPAGRPIAHRGEAIVAASSFVSALVIRWSVRTGRAWRGAMWLASTTFMIGLATGLHLVADLADRGVRGPRIANAFFLVLLVPTLGAVRAEYRVHIRPEDRREIGIDAGLIAVSLATIWYVLLRPIGGNVDASVTAAVFALLAMVPASALCALTVWLPSRIHVLQLAVFVVLSAALLLFGRQWAGGSAIHPSAFTLLTFMLFPLMLAAIVALGPDSAAGVVERARRRWARPILTSLSVVTACAALITVSILGRARGVSARESSAIIVALGLGIAARILSSQIISTQAHRQVRGALDQKEAALQEADLALDRVRESAETLRQSEEHLRLVFDAAVDGIVELDQRGVILRANEAFCAMVNLDRAGVEGHLWSALAAAADGVDDSFATLPTTGQAQITRPEGQPMYLESRVSEIPTDPPRRLLLVRDVTAGRVADQTIRSLFQFLQDRDEDRTRLLRRTNSAIESERNRVARDLHDGPVQGVSAASLSLEAALLMIKAGEIDRGIEMLGRIRLELAEEADGLRQLMSGLRPPVLEERGLIPALRETLVRFGAEHGVVTEFGGTLMKPLPEDLETLAYRVVQEALSNAGKHADADRISVSLESDASQLRIEVEDDGRGFDSGRMREFLRMGRVGLASMRERVELASGTFLVRSTPGRGTTIMATLPMDDAIPSRELARDAAI
jgi:PAS domain S-box-containing protein